MGLSRAALFFFLASLCLVSSRRHHRGVPHDNAKDFPVVFADAGNGEYKFCVPMNVVPWGDKYHASVIFYFQNDEQKDVSIEFSFQEEKQAHHLNRRWLQSNSRFKLHDMDGNAYNGWTSQDVFEHQISGSFFTKGALKGANMRFAGDFVQGTRENTCQEYFADPEIRKLFEATATQGEEEVEIYETYHHHHDHNNEHSGFHHGYNHDHAGYNHEHSGYNHEHVGYNHEHEHSGFNHEHAGYNHEHQHGGYHHHGDQEIFHHHAHEQESEQVVGHHTASGGGSIGLTQGVAIHDAVEDDSKVASEQQEMYIDGESRHYYPAFFFGAIFFFISIFVCCCCVAAGIQSDQEDREVYMVSSFTTERDDDEILNMVQQQSLAEYEAQFSAPQAQPPVPTTTYPGDAAPPQGYVRVPVLTPEAYAEHLAAAQQQQQQQ